MGGAFLAIIELTDRSPIWPRNEPAHQSVLPRLNVRCVYRPRQTSSLFALNRAESSRRWCAMVRRPCPGHLFSVGLCVEPSPQANSFRRLSPQVDGNRRPAPKA